MNDRTQYVVEVSARSIRRLDPAATPETVTDDVIANVLRDTCRDGQPTTFAILAELIRAELGAAR
jgi:hypothetical protein